MKMLSTTLPRLGSRVRIPSPAPSTDPLKGAPEHATERERALKVGQDWGSSFSERPIPLAPTAHNGPLGPARKKGKSPSAPAGNTKSDTFSVNVRTWNERPPIPNRGFDWGAVDDNTYDGGGPIGWGATEEAAVADLMDQLF